MERSPAIKRCHAVFLGIVLLAFGRAWWTSGGSEASMVGAMAVLGAAWRTVVLRIAIKQEVDSSPTRSIQRVDWERIFKL